MAEGGLQDVLDGEIAIGERGDDGRILAARLGVEIKMWPVGEHRERRVGPASEDHRIDAGMADQPPALLSARARQELENLARHPRSPEALAQFPGHQHGVRSRLQDHRVAGRQRCGDATTGNRDGEVPRRHHDDHTLGPRPQRRQ